MKLVRWVFLVLCGLLSIVLVVPVRSATDLVNGDFSLGTAPDEIDGWLRDVTKVQAVLDEGTFRSYPRSLRSGGGGDMSYSQCVDTSGLTSVDVGGWVWLAAEDSGSIEVTLYSTSDCTGDEAAGGSTMTLPNENYVKRWVVLWQTYPLPKGQESTSVRIVLNASTIADCEAYFDDIFVEKSGATGVLVMQPSGRASTSDVVAAALVGIGAAIACLRRH